MFAAMKSKKKVHPKLKITCFTLLLSEVPRQPGSYECGYFVMRYMKDIIADVSLLLTNVSRMCSYSYFFFAL